MKIKQNVLNHKTYSQIINAVLNKRNYAEAIAKELNFKPPSILPHLKELCKEGLLCKDKQRRFNKTIYKINSKKILTLFIDYCYNIDNFHKLEFIQKSDFLESKLLSNFLLACLKNRVHHPNKEKRTLKDDFNLIIGDIPTIEANFQSKYEKIEPYFERLLHLIGSLETQRLIVSIGKIIEDFENYTFKKPNSSK